MVGNRKLAIFSQSNMHSLIQFSNCPIAFMSSDSQIGLSFNKGHTFKGGHH